MHIFQIVVLALLSISQAQADSDLLLERGLYFESTQKGCGIVIQFSDNGQVLYFRYSDVEFKGCGSSNGQTYIYKKVKDVEVGRTFYKDESNSNVIEIISSSEFLLKYSGFSYTLYYSLGSKSECTK